MDNFIKNNTIRDSIRPYPPYVSYTAAVFSIIISIFGIFGNIITIIAFLKSPKIQKNVTTKFIINLAISDLIISAVSLPILTGQFLYDDWLLDKMLCKISSVLLYGNINVSLLSMTFIALNRYIIVIKPKIHPRLFNDSNVTIMFSAIWAISYLERLPPTLGIWGKIDLDPKTKICGSCKSNEEDGGVDPNLVLTIIAFTTPCVVMGYSYLCIYLKLRKVHKNLNSHSSSQLASLNNEKTDNDERKVTKLMFILFVSFLVCFLPMMLIVIIIDPDRNYPSLHVASAVLNCAFVIINPFIYAGSNKLYRQAYKQIFYPATHSITNAAITHQASRSNIVYQ